MSKRDERAAWGELCDSDIRFRIRQLRSLGLTESEAQDLWVESAKRFLGVLGLAVSGPRRRSKK